MLRMRRLVLLPLLAAPLMLAQTPPAQRVGPAKPVPPVTLRSTPLDQLHSTHDKADWFVPR